MSPTCYHLVLIIFITTLFLELPPLANYYETVVPVALSPGSLQVSYYGRHSQSASVGLGTLSFPIL